MFTQDYFRGCVQLVLVHGFQLAPRDNHVRKTHLGSPNQEHNGGSLAGVPIKMDTVTFAGNTPNTNAPG